MQQNIADKIIRFHVIANSDSQADQELKLAVRDAVGMQMQNKLEGASDLEESRQIVRENLSEMELVAASVIADQGYDYPDWWCVMYPNLCFQGNLYEVDDAGNAAALQETFSNEEYAAIMEKGDYEVRFKVLEILEQCLGK